MSALPPWVRWLPLPAAMAAAAIGWFRTLKAGTEFVQYEWYSDVDAGTVFFHDHVDGIHSWGHGLFAAHIIEPAGSTFHDPVTAATIRSGPIADIFTNGSAGFGEQGSFAILGHAFPLDHGIAHSMVIDNRTLFAGETFDAYLVNGAGGATHAAGDYLYDVNRRPMVKSGQWGIFRVLPRFSTAIPAL